MLQRFSSAITQAVLFSGVGIPIYDYRVVPATSYDVDLLSGFYMTIQSHALNNELGEMVEVLYSDHHEIHFYEHVFGPDPVRDGVFLALFGARQELAID